MSDSLGPRAVGTWDTPQRAALPPLPYFRYYLADGGGRPYIDRTGENGTPPARYLSLSLPTRPYVERDEYYPSARVCKARGIKFRPLNKPLYAACSFELFKTRNVVDERKEKAGDRKITKNRSLSNWHLWNWHLKKINFLLEFWMQPKEF